MKFDETFEAFNNGVLPLPNQTISFINISWSQHPSFDGVELNTL